MTDSELEKLIGYMDLYHVYRSKEESDLGAKESIRHYVRALCAHTGQEIVGTVQLIEALKVSKKRWL